MAGVADDFDGEVEIGGFVHQLQPVASAVANRCITQGQHLRMPSRITWDPALSEMSAGLRWTVSRRPHTKFLTVPGCVTRGPASERGQVAVKHQPSEAASRGAPMLRPRWGLRSPDSRLTPGIIEVMLNPERASVSKACCRRSRRRQSSRSHKPVAGIETTG